MSLGVVLVCHTALDRAEQVARHWSAAGCPIVIHVDRKVDKAVFETFRAALSELPDVRFCKRHRCEWGTWGIVAASLSGAEMMLEDFPEVRHVYLASGSCLPLRPISELRAYLNASPRTDFIESATTADVPWTVGGLDEERFTLRFPFSWKRSRWLFDRFVALQRRLGLKRRIPAGLVPHMGSQWWCLTRQTLTRILEDPARDSYQRYFRRVWIPDESFFQTLTRLHSDTIESRSLTLSKFDFQGKPHIFYDDHLKLLRRSDCFVARKIWPHADRLYAEFLDGKAGSGATEPNTGKIDRVFAKAVDRRTRGRPGLYMQSRFPNEGWENGVTSSPYCVFEGFADLFANFEEWLAQTTDCRVHGHLFHPDGAQFEGRQSTYTGALSAAPKLRDHDPKAFLTNLIWNTRGERQAFQFGPGDSQDIGWSIAKDPNAHIWVISGAWAIPLFTSRRDFADLRSEAAALQRIESKHLDALRSPYAKARIKIWTLAEFIENPMEALQTVVDEIAGPTLRRLTEVPRMTDLTGFGQFLQNLKNEGMHPYLMGDFPIERQDGAGTRPQRKPYLVR